MSMVFWLFYNPVQSFTLSIPGSDNRPDSNNAQNELVIIGEKFIQYAEHNSELLGKWTRFRGADLDNIVKDKTKLINKFGNEGPKILWQVDLGEGHAAPVIYNGKAYILDYDETNKADALRCFALETGEELWNRSYNVHIKRNHGMSRSVPAINDNYIVTIGPKGHVMCSDPKNGNLLWGLDLIKDYKTEIPFWYTGQCPMIDNNIAIIAPSGTKMMLGVDCATGKVVWETPNPDNWTMSHSSIMKMKIHNKAMYVYAAVGGIIGISAEEEDKGKILWKTNAFNPNVVAPSPLYVGNNKIFMTAGYGAGTILFEITKNKDLFEVQILQKYKPKEGAASEQQTSVLYNGLMYTILPKDAGANRNQMVCTNPSDGKNLVWTSGKTNRFGLGPYIIADGKFFILNDDGTLTIAKVNKSGFTLLDQKRIIEGHDAWGPFAIADGYMLMRDSKKMVCLNIKK